MKELYLNMPVSEYFGWGICGKNLLTEFSKKTNVRYVENGFTCTVRMPETIELVNKLKVMPKDTNSPFIHATMPDFKPCVQNRGKPNIGYAFYEEFTMTDEFVGNAKRYFDVIVGGSTWNKELFESYGLKSEAIPQGVNRRIFYPDDKYKECDRTWSYYVDGTIKGNPNVAKKNVCWINENEVKIAVLLLRYYYSGSDIILENLDDLKIDFQIMPIRKTT